MIAVLLRKILSQVLNRITELKSEQIGVSVWNGDIKLSEVRVKEEVVQRVSPESALRLVSGFLGSVHISLPWYALYSAPWVIHIENVHFCFQTEPTQTSATVKEDDTLLYKRHYLNQTERYWQDASFLSVRRVLTSQFNVFFSSFINHFIQLATKQLHIVIRNVRVEFKDISCTPPRFQDPFTLVIALDECQIRTLKETNEIIEKLCLLRGLSVSCAPASNRENVEEYLLEPLTLTIRLTMSRSTEVSSLPKYTVEIDVESLHIHLNDQQIQRLCHLLNLLTTPRQSLNVMWRHRPEKSPRQAPVEWWSYLCLCVLHTERVPPQRAWNLSHIAQRRRDRLLYMNLYTHKLLTGVLSPAQSLQFDRLEQLYPLSDLLLWRQWARAQLQVIKKFSVKQNTPQTLMNRINTFTKQTINWGLQRLGRQSASSFPSVLPPQMLHELRSVFHTLTPPKFDEQHVSIESSSSTTTTSHLSPFYVHSSVSVHLDRVLFVLHKSETALCCCEVNEIGLQLVHRPRYESKSITLSVRSLTVRQLALITKTLPPLVVSTPSPPFITLQWDTNPLRWNGERLTPYHHSFTLHVRTLDCTVNVLFLLHLLHLFTSAELFSSSLPSTQSSASSLPKTPTRFSSQRVLFDVWVQAPRVMLPLSIHGVAAPCVVLNLGHYTLYSVHNAATATVLTSHNSEVDVTRLCGENISIQLASTTTNLNELSPIETIVVPFTLSGHFYHHHPKYSTVSSSYNTSLNARHRIVVQVSDIKLLFSALFISHFQTFLLQFTNVYKNVISSASSEKKLLHKTTAESSLDSSKDQIDIELFLPRCNFVLCDLLTLEIMNVNAAAIYKYNNDVTVCGKLQQIRISSLLETSRSLPLFLLQPAVSLSSSQTTMLEPNEGLIVTAQLTTRSNQTAVCQLHLHIGDVFLSPPSTHTLSRFLALSNDIFLTTTTTTTVSTSVPATIPSQSTRSIPPSSAFVSHVTVCVKSVSVVLSLPTTSASTTPPPTPPTTATTLIVQQPMWTLSWQSDIKNYKMQFHIRAVTLRSSSSSSSNVCVLSLPNAFLLCVVEFSLSGDQIQTWSLHVPSLNVSLPHDFLQQLLQWMNEMNKTVVNTLKSNQQRLSSSSFSLPTPTSSSSSSSTMVLPCHSRIELLIGDISVSYLTPDKTTLMLTLGDVALVSVNEPPSSHNIQLVMRSFNIALAQHDLLRNFTVSVTIQKDLPHTDPKTTCMTVRTNEFKVLFSVRQWQPLCSVVSGLDSLISLIETQSPPQSATHSATNFCPLVIFVEMPHVSVALADVMWRVSLMLSPLSGYMWRRSVGHLDSGVRIGNMRVDVQCGALTQCVFSSMSVGSLTSDSSSPHLQLLTSVLVVDDTASRTLRTNVVAELSPSDVVLCPQLLCPLLSSFLTSPLVTHSLTLQSLSSSKHRTSSISSPSSQTTSSRVNSVYDIRFAIPQFRLLLPLTPTEHERHSLIFSMSLITHYTTPQQPLDTLSSTSHLHYKCTVFVSRCSLAIAALFGTKEKILSLLMQPKRMSMVVDGHPENVHIQIRCKEPLVLSVTLRDTLFFHLLLTTWRQSTSSLLPSISTHTSASASASSIDNSKSISRRVATVQIDLALSELSLMLLDDDIETLSNDLSPICPLVHVTLNNVSLSTCREQQQDPLFQTRFGCTLSMRVFDVERWQWQTLLSAWSFDVDFQQRGPDTSITCESLQRLHITLHRNTLHWMIKTLPHLLQTWQQRLHQQQLHQETTLSTTETITQQTNTQQQHPHRQLLLRTHSLFSNLNEIHRQPLRYTPYRLRNATGLPIRYTLNQKMSQYESGNINKETTVTSSFRLSSTSTSTSTSTLLREVNVDEEVPLVDVESLMQQCLLSVSVILHIPPFNALHLPLYTPSNFIVPLQPQPKTPLYLVWEVFSPGVRRLRTGVRFVNTLPATSVALILHSKYWKEGPLRYVLRSGADWPLPLPVLLHFESVFVSLRKVNATSELLSSDVLPSQERESRGRTRTRRGDEHSSKSNNSPHTNTPTSVSTEEGEGGGGGEGDSSLVDLCDFFQRGQEKFVAPYLLRISGNVAEGDVTVFIDSQLSIENLLPIPLTLRVTDLCTERILLSDVILSSGDVLPLLITHPSHALSMSVTLPGFVPSEEVLINTGVGSTAESVTTSIKIYNEQIHTPLYLKIDYTSTATNSTSRRVTVFCTYWILNRTGLPLRFRDVTSNTLLPTPSQHIDAENDKYLHSISTISQTPGVNLKREWYDTLPSTTQPVLYGPDPTSESAELRIALRDGGWSHPLRLEPATGWRGLVELPSILGVLNFTVSMHLAPARYARTKIITFFPRYVLYNSLSVPLYYKQLNSTIYYTLGPGEYVPWHWTHTKHRQICITLGSKEDVAEGRCHWSGGILLDHIGEVALNLRDISRKRILHFLNVDVGLGEGGSHFVTIRAANASIPPYRIDNHTQELLLVYQEGHRECSLQLGPYESQPFAWEYPAESHVLWVEFPQYPNLTPRAYHLDQVADFAPIVIPASSSSSSSPPSTPSSPVPRSRRLQDHRSLSRSAQRQRRLHQTRLAVTLSLSGPTRVLAFRDLALHRQLTSDETKTSVSSIPRNVKRENLNLRVHIAFREVSVQVKNNLDFTTNQDSDEDNIRDNSDQQTSLHHLLHVDSIESSATLFNVVVDAPTIDYLQTPAAHSVEIQVASAQLENPQLTTPCPVVLATTMSQDRPWLHIVLVKSHYYTDIDYFHYVALALQEFTISLDVDWLNAVLHFLYSLTSPADLSTWITATPALPTLTENVRCLNDKHVYLELLHINPMKVNINFVSNPNLTSSSSPSANLALMLLRTAGLSVADIDNVTFLLNALIITHPYTTHAELFTLITRHYMIQLLKQAYRVLGAFDVIGNPLSLMSTLGTGVYDFFYEPAQSLVTRPQDLIKALARGTTSLISKSVFGLLNSATKITSSLSKVTATLSMDEKYMAKTANAIAAVSLYRTIHFAGASAHRLVPPSVLESMQSGVAGLLLRRRRHRVQHESMLQGVAYGMMGFVFKPLTGLLATVMHHCARARNTMGRIAFGLHALAAPHRRISPPRIHLLTHLLHSFNGHRYRDHHYRTHWYISEEHTLYLISDKAFFTVLLTSTTCTVVSVIWLSDLRQVQTRTDSTQAVLYYTPSTDSFVTSSSSVTSSPQSSESSQWPIRLPKNHLQTKRILSILGQASSMSSSHS